MTDDRIVRVSSELQRAWVDWDPGCDPSPPLTVRQSAFVRQAFVAGWLAAKAMETREGEDAAERLRAEHDSAARRVCPDTVSIGKQGKG